MPNIPFPSDIPFSLQEVRDEFDRLLDRVWHGGLTTAPLDGQDWAPRLDVYEYPDSFEVRVEVSGVSADDVEVSILENVLTIKGTKPKPEDPADGVRRLRSECRYGSFCRTYEFSAPVQDNAVTATSRNGVLDIKIPKTQESKGRTVKVESAD
ncbi:MAG: Hsp20/alpha crystallin family protein [Phycisphaerales bacterium]|nr:Hsp20/alpha crystallin family protein [Phycisphaerales bacterium]